MNFLLKLSVIAFIALFISGCTLHFKGKDVELKTERQRVESNQAYELARADILNG